MNKLLNVVIDTSISFVSGFGAAAIIFILFDFYKDYRRPTEYFSLFDPTLNEQKEIARFYKNGDVKTFFGVAPSEAAEKFWKVIMDQKLHTHCYTDEQIIKAVKK